VASGRTATEHHQAGTGRSGGPLPEQRTPSDAEPSDAELLRRHVDGDPEAFGELFLRHRDRLWAVAVRTLSDPEDAADALQDAMISAFRRAGSFRGESAVTTWLHRIVVNACLDRMRRRAARPTTDGADERTLDNLAAGHTAPDPSSDSDTSLDVMAALRMLPPEQQAALVLVDMLGYPVADAADILGVSEGTVKSRCARGRARLLPRLGHLRRAAPSPGPGKPAGAPSQPAATDGHPGPGTDSGNRSATRHVLPAREGGDEPR
jgi:RNA polymerase sigma-70 factor, ECF subfamily